MQRMKSKHGMIWYFYIKKLTKPIDPDQLTRQDSNEVYQKLMKSISERTTKNKFYVDYVEEVLK